jgi:hypothetical protein
MRERPNAFVKRNGADGTGNSINQLVAGVSCLTTGWQASCTCNAEVVPCVVLDCFNGSGTSGVVAAALGRDYIGIELNPEYAEMAKRRIAKGYDPAPKAEVLAGQKSLFGEAS